MRMKSVGNKRDLMAVVIYNDEATNSIPVGAPVVMSYSGTQDGLAVVLPATAADVKQTSLGFGVCLGDGKGGALLAKGYGEAQVFGHCPNVKLLRTRAASTDAFVSIIAGALLKAESVSNCFQTAASVGASVQMPAAVLASSISAAGSAISSQTILSVTQMVAAFLRMM